MARTSAKAKKSKQEVNKKKEEAKQQDENKTDEGTGDSTDKENDSVNYDVEKITHTRMFKGKRQYLVRWKGYAEESDTWENESALQSCKEVLDAFKKEHLIDLNSDEELSDKEEEQKGKNKSKKVAKKVSKSVKKSGKQSKSKKGIEESQTESEIEEEEKTKDTDSENSDKKIKRKSREVITREDSQSDSDVQDEVEEKSKKKGGKGKNKGKVVKDTEESGEVSEEKSKDKEPKGKKRNAAKETESSKAKKAKKVESDDESVTDGKDYEVEKIIEVHTRKDGSREFLIRWKGYKPSEDTWEPEAHLDCQDLIDKFMEKVDKAKSLSRKELRENRTQTKRFIPFSSRSGHGRSQRNSGFRPCYTESAYED